jgi:hypothetical protein
MFKELKASTEAALSFKEVPYKHGQLRHGIPKVEIVSKSEKF